MNLVERHSDEARGLGHSGRGVPALNPGPLHNRRESPAGAGLVVARWHTLVDDFHTSTSDFYTAVQRGIRERAVPGARFSRVKLREGGFASPKRLYLRVRRGPLFFYVCAAPYGTATFFSSWLVRRGPRFPRLYALGALLAVAGVLWALAGLLGLDGRVAYPLAGLLAAALIAWLARMGALGSERRLLRGAVTGWLYERLFFPATLFSADAALMFHEAVGRAVAEVVDDLLTAEGRRALSDDQRRPTILDLTGGAPHAHR